MAAGRPPPRRGRLPRRAAGPAHRRRPSPGEVAGHRARSGRRARHPGQDDRPAHGRAGHDAPRSVCARHMDVHRRPGAALARRAQVRAHRRLRRRGAHDDPRPAWPGAARQRTSPWRPSGKRLRARRARLKPLLLDQAFLAGVGNIYADEALWRARLHPLRHASTLRRGDERRLYLALRGVLQEAIDRRGSSINDYTAPEGDGEMQEHLDVYQRTGQPCHRCGRPIRRIVLGARGTHFCSWCQRLPRSERDASAARLLRAGA